MYYLKIINVSNNTKLHFSLEANQIICALFFSLTYKPFFPICLDTVYVGIERKLCSPLLDCPLQQTAITSKKKSSLSLSPSQFFLLFPFPVRDIMILSITHTEHLEMTSDRPLSPHVRSPSESCLSLLALRCPSPLSSLLTATAGIPAQPESSQTSALLLVPSRVPVSTLFSIPSS